MANAGRLSNAGELFAFEFDDNSNASFSVSKESTVFSSEFDENTSTDIGVDQRMSATSGGNLIVLDSINEVDTFDDIPTSNLELHLDDEFLTEGTAQGQQVFTSNGTFTVPTGVTQVSAVVVGGGGGGAGSDGDRDEGNTGGGGGGLAYGTFTVTPGETLTVTVGAGGTSASGDDGTAGGTTTIARGATVLLSGGGGLGGQERSTGARAGGASGGTERDGGGTGGSSGSATDDNSGSGGGGAAGYSGNGGAGGSNGGSGSAGSGGGGAGGNSATTGTADGGGGVGILGEGANGAASGGGGSGGAANSGFTGGDYGGGGGARDDDSAGSGGAGGAGAARIIWGPGRSYPSTLTADQTAGTATNFWKDLSGNSRHSKITDAWDPYNNINGSAGVSTGTIGPASNFIDFPAGVQPGQSVKVSNPRTIDNVGMNDIKYRLYNCTDLSTAFDNGDVTADGEVTANATLVKGPISIIEGDREYFELSNTRTLIVPPQHTFYNVVTITNSNATVGYTLFSTNAQILDVAFESSSSRFCVCDGTGTASAYTGVTGTSARTVILGVKFPASPASSYSAFSYGANSTGQRFNIRLMSTGQIRISFGNSNVEIQTTEIDDLNDFQLIAITIPASGTVSDVRVWLNGNEVTSQLNVSNGSTSINTSSANNVTIGADVTTTNPEYLDDSVITKVMIYSVVLSDLEIKQIYQSIIPDIYPFVERAS